MKWIDVTKYLPGNNKRHILCRIIIDDNHDHPNYFNGEFINGKWEDVCTGGFDITWQVTHWMYLEDI